MTTAVATPHPTTSLCAVCKRGTPAEIVEADGRIIMRKTCPEHGAQEVLIASDAAWYRDVMSSPAAVKAPAVARNQVHAGCPYDCGPCASHRQSMCLPVIPITSACDLNCPICYTINRNDDAFYMSLDEFARILDVIRRNDPAMKIINLTGGEPTLHPQLARIIRLCHEAGIHRVTISTHGLTFLANEKLLAELAELRARIVLSFNTFDDAANERMLGMKAVSAKLKLLELLARYDVATTLLPVVARGINDSEVGALVDLLRTRDSIRSLEIHTLTFTGRGGRGFEPDARLTTPDVLRGIETATQGAIRLRDFVPSPCAHPLCYQACYLLQTGPQRFVPFARFMSRDHVRSLLADNLYMEPGERLENVLQNVIAELWTAAVPDDTGREVLQALKKLIQDLFPSRPLAYHRQQLIAERSAKAIYIHSHMDDESFDTDRIRRCCVAVPGADGSTVPTCAYNILYRERDPRFCRGRFHPLSALAGGRKSW